MSFSLHFSATVLVIRPTAHSPSISNSKNLNFSTGKTEQTSYQAAHKVRGLEQELKEIILSTKKIEHLPLSVNK